MIGIFVYKLAISMDTKIASEGIFMSLTIEIRHAFILSFLNCQSKNCVISLYCKKCGPISIRFCSSNAQEYITCILKIIHTKFHDPLFLHFNSSSHDINDFGFQVIQSISFRYPYNILLKWILRLKTFSDQGIDFYLFYPQRFWFTVVPFVTPGYFINMFHKYRYVCITPILNRGVYAIPLN